MADLVVQAAAPSLDTDNEHLFSACHDGCILVDKLVQAYMELQENGSNGSGEAVQAHFPHMLPLARALVFLKTVKAGALLGVQHGSGFIIARLPPGDSEWGMGRSWSPPCFVKVETLIGVMTDSALQHLISSKQVTLGAELSIALPFMRSSDGWDTMFNSDLAVVRIGRGLMLDLSLESEVISIDHDRNRACYGRGPGGSSGRGGGGACGPGGNWSGVFGGSGGGSAAGGRGASGGGLLAGLLGGGEGGKGGRSSGGSSSWGGGGGAVQEGQDQLQGPLSPAAILGGRLPPCPEMQQLEEKLSEAACCAVVSAYEQSWHAARSPWRQLRSSGAP